MMVINVIMKKIKKILINILKSGKYCNKTKNMKCQEIKQDSDRKVKMNLVHGKVFYRKIKLIPIQDKIAMKYSIFPAPADPDIFADLIGSP
jgi:hypothetical protein